jgi:hypothetical protein
MSRDETMYLQDIADSCARILRYTEGLTQTGLIQEEKSSTKTEAHPPYGRARGARIGEASRAAVSDAEVQGRQWHESMDETNRGGAGD